MHLQVAGALDGVAHFEAGGQVLIYCLPALPAQVRGPEALGAFSKNLLKPYQGRGAAAGDEQQSGFAPAATLQAELGRLQARVAELEAQLAGNRRD